MSTAEQDVRVRELVLAGMSPSDAVEQVHFGSVVTGAAEGDVVTTSIDAVPAQYIYVDSAVGGVHRRNRVVNVGTFSPNGTPDCYTTWARFTEDLRDHVNRTGSVSSYPGPAYADFVPLDFDDEVDPSRALDDVRRFLAHVETVWDIPPDAPRIFFSGCKGFSVELPSSLFGGFEPSADLTQRVKALVLALVEGLDLSTLDAGIYDTLRLWRTPNSRHTKSGLYKVPLSYSEVRDLDIAGIRELARGPRTVDWLPDDEWMFRPDLAALWRSVRPATAGSRAYEQLGGVIHEGRGRHNALVSYAGKAFVEGMDIDTLVAVLDAVNQNQCVPPLPDVEVVAIAKHFVERREPGRDDSIFCQAPKERFGQKESGGALRFRTAAELAAETPPEVGWLWRGYVARGAVTELDAKVKLGKTTLLLDLVRAVVDGRPFMNAVTPKTAVVYLTEQPASSFREALRRADLLDREDVHVLHFTDTLASEWNDVVDAAIARCIEVGAGLLVVDTLTQFARLRGEAENQSGAAQEAMEPLQRATAKDIAVAVARHERKSGGEVGDSGRGSSAFAGTVDVVVAMKRADGNARPSLRVLHALSRFDETPEALVIERLATGYVVVGTEAAVATKEAREALLAVGPESEEDALKEKQLFDLLPEHISRTTAQQALSQLQADGHYRRKGKGVKGDAYRYWRSANE